MSKPPDSPLERLRKFPLAAWGGLCIFGGLMAGLITPLVMPPQTGAAARGAAVGRGLATLMFVVTGVVLIVLHFVRGGGGKSGGKPGAKAGGPPRRR